MAEEEHRAHAVAAGLSGPDYRDQRPLRAGSVNRGCRVVGAAGGWKKTALPEGLRHQGASLPGGGRLTRPEPKRGRGEQSRPRKKPFFDSLNPGMQATATSVRCAPAFGCNSRLVLDANGAVVRRLPHNC
jgi:hypothetical protein